MRLNKIEMNRNGSSRIKEIRNTMMEKISRFQLKNVPSGAESFLQFSMEPDLFGVKKSRGDSRVLLGGCLPVLTLLIRRRLETRAMSGLYSDALRRGVPVDPYPTKKLDLTDNLTGYKIPGLRIRQ